MREVFKEQQTRIKQLDDNVRQLEVKLEAKDDNLQRVIRDLDAIRETTRRNYWVNIAVLVIVIVILGSY